MLTVENLSFSFPNKDLYDQVTFTLEKGQHCAFIGTSGSGKSTLIEMIMNPDYHLYDGKIIKDDLCRIGYISQFIPEDTHFEDTVLQFIAAEYYALQHKLTDVCTKMETESNLDKLMEVYQETLDAIDAIGGHDLESAILKKLHLAGLTDLKDQKIGTLSGGEFKLVQVIKEMLQGPELLIMDEPDVFLDFTNLIALKKLINAHKGILLVITHNRYLLNHCFNKIIHLENKELQEFDGSYIEYNFSLLEKKVELQELSVADDEEIARNEELIHKLRLIATYNSEASRGKALKARVKIQERLKSRRIKAPFVEIKQPNLKLFTEMPLQETTGIEVKNLTLAFDDILLEPVSFEIQATDKVALIGKNGCGKTTLLRSIINKDRETISHHEDLNIAYLAQNQTELLDEAATIKDMFYRLGFHHSDDIRRYLYNYGFEEEMLTQKIGRLSGGEKTILQLAKLSKDNANFLLLDEPTSHLDTYSQLALESALKEYNGGFLMVSHDYYTIANCVDYVLIIENKTIRKLSTRKFRKLIYEDHFDKNYLEKEKSRKALELEIEAALSQMDFEKAKLLCEKLDEIISVA